MMINLIHINLIHIIISIFPLCCFLIVFKCTRWFWPLCHCFFPLNPFCDCLTKHFIQFIHFMILFKMLKRDHFFKLTFLRLKYILKLYFLTLTQLCFRLNTWTFDWVQFLLRMLHNFSVPLHTLAVTIYFSSQPPV